MNAITSNKPYPKFLTEFTQVMVAGDNRLAGQAALEETVAVELNAAQAVREHAPLGAQPGLSNVVQAIQARAEAVVKEEVGVFEATTLAMGGELSALFAASGGTKAKDAVASLAKQMHEELRDPETSWVAKNLEEMADGVVTRKNIKRLADVVESILDKGLRFSAPGGGHESLRPGVKPLNAKERSSVAKALAAHYPGVEIPALLQERNRVLFALTTLLNLATVALDEQPFFTTLIEEMKDNRKMSEEAKAEAKRNAGPTGSDPYQPSHAGILGELDRGASDLIGAIFGK